MFDYIASVRGDDYLPVVQCLDDSMEATQCLRQFNLL